MKNKIIYRFFNDFIRPIWKTQIVAFVFLLLDTMFAVSFPYFTKLIIDDAIGQKNLTLLLLYGVGMLLNGLLVIVFGYLQFIKFAQIGQKVIANIKGTIIKKLEVLSWNYFSKKNTGEIIAIIERDVNSIESIATRAMSDIIINLIKAVALFVVLLVIDLQIGLSALVLLPLFVYFERKVGKITRERTMNLRKVIGDLQSYTQEIVSNMSFIQLINYKDTANKMYDQKIKQYIDSSIKLMIAHKMGSIVSLSFNTLGLLLVFGLGGYFVIQGRISIGLLFTLSVYIQRVYGPIINLADSYVSIQGAKAILSRIYEVLDETDVIEDGHYRPTSPLRGHIQIGDLVFDYGNRKVFDTVTLEINPGEVVGLMGPNGSGKTTFARLLTRLCDPKDGTIMIDGYKVKDYQLEFLRSEIGYMTQGVHIFNGSIRENILMESPEASEIDLQKALEMVHFCEDIKKMPHGLNTVVGERGVNLSEGQRQKLALARMILKNPSILILDEPTAAFDLDSEIILSEYLGNYINDKTVIIITHRPEILRHCSKVYNINSNKIFESQEIA